MLPSPRPWFCPWRTWYCLLPVLGLLLTTPAEAQQQPSLRLGGLTPAGGRNNATDGWIKLDFDLTNFTEVGRLARVVVAYKDRPEVEYARDVWVPAHATLNSWLLLGPAPAHGPAHGREIEFRLYDRTAGHDVLIRPAGDERIRSRAVPYRARDPFTAIVLDDPSPQPQDGQLPQPDSPSDEALQLARTFRITRKLPAAVTVLDALPPTATAFDAVDHVIIASDRIARDTTGLRALRHWLEQGGQVWVLLDRVSPDTVAPLLGDALDFQRVDRIELTEFQLTSGSGGLGSVEPMQQHERPVALTRILLPDGERGRHHVNGWPAWFIRSVGRGKIVFTTLGPRSWSRPRKHPPDSPSFDSNFPDLPVALGPLEILAFELQSPPNAEAFQLETFGPILTDEIGYDVPGRRTVVLIVVGSVLLAVVLGLALRNARRPELLGWLGPAIALATAVLLFVLGEQSRRAAPATVAVGQVVEGIAGQEETAVRGLLARYSPDSGEMPVTASHGGLLELNLEGLQGQTRRFVLTDSASWHWEALSLPAGVRLGTFRGHRELPSGEYLTAQAHFGPDGLEGKLATSAFQNVSDAILAVPGGQTTPLRLETDGSFHTTSADPLPPGQFLSGAVLSDREQRRHALYREFLRHAPERPVVLAWAKPVDLGFEFGPTRESGDALLVAPLQLRRRPGADRVTVPGILVPYQRLRDGVPMPFTFRSNQAADLELRFQLPAEVLPLDVERARLHLRIEATGREVAIFGGAATELYRGESPLEPIRLDLAGQPWLKPDKAGGLHFRIAIGGTPASGGVAGDAWKIEQLDLEVTGRVRNAEER